MVGANIFVMYADGNGNVTVSPRLGKGHFEPEHDTAANVALLEGSGVADGRMVANIRCDNCESWQGGTMDFTASSGGWIFASRPGPPIDSTSPSANIVEHQDHGTFTWDFSSAQGGSDVNPFVSGDDSGDPVSPAPTGGNDGGDDVSSESDGGGDLDVMTTAHGVLASLAFLVLFPSGAIFIRIPFLAKFGGIWMHAAIQIFAYCTFIAAAGLGIYLATQEELLRNHHPIIGMILLGMVFTQPSLSFPKKEATNTHLISTHLRGQGSDHAWYNKRWFRSRSRGGEEYGLFGCVWGCCRRYGISLLGSDHLWRGATGQDRQGI